VRRWRDVDRGSDIRTNITRQAIAKHLRVLADAGLVRDVKAGRERLWECERRAARRGATIAAAH